MLQILTKMLENIMKALAKGNTTIVPVALQATRGPWRGIASRPRGARRQPERPRRHTLRPLGRPRRGLRVGACFLVCNFVCGFSKLTYFFW